MRFSKRKKFKGRGQSGWNLGLFIIQLYYPVLMPLLSLTLTLTFLSLFDPSDPSIDHHACRQCCHSSLQQVLQLGRPCEGSGHLCRSWKEGFGYPFRHQRPQGNIVTVFIPCCVVDFVYSSGTQSDWGNPCTCLPSLGDRSELAAIGG